LPTYGKSSGGTSITITGTGFGIDKNVVHVTIDQVECVVATVTSREITCTSGDRDTFRSSNSYSSESSFSVTIDG